ncbi:hypothetical protein BBP40_009565 [Aspergillus hancockii]|nr:hypothetical protein BBP40_009565 [Aspergillus hancockii]
MDPRQRLMLENVYHALENAGITLDKAASLKTSVFVGGSSHDHMISSNADTETTLKHQATGTHNSIMANRVSWCFNFKGPSIYVGTACSGSLVAVHLVTQSLKLGECDMAMVCGVNYLGGPHEFINMDHGNFWGQKDDVFHSIIELKDMLEPKGPGKIDRETYRLAGLDPKYTMFVEAHGTGTVVGDVIESKAIANAFASAKRTLTLHIGAMKSGIGHLESAAGIAGIIKSILVLESGVIPPNTNLEKINPDIQAKELNLGFPTKTIP